MKNFIILFFTIISIPITYTQDRVIIEDGENICDKLNIVLADYDVICLTIRSNKGPAYTTVKIDCPLVLGEGKKLIVPSRTKILLEGDAEIKLNGEGASIVGEHVETSQIIVGDNGPLVLEGCNNCTLSEISVIGDGDNTTIEIDENSDGSTVNSVKVEEAGTGIVVKSDNNTFTDLQFQKVAIDLSDCEADDNDDAAVKLMEANYNSFTNIIHTRSQGAISVFLDGKCDYNEIMNLSTEQEKDEGASIDCLTANDPALYINNSDSYGNIVITNFNHGKTVLNGQGTICQNNTITDITGCINQNITIDCPEE